ncbi:MAG: hypothetical protein GY733_16025, partial [bacterium]|nr:hypothetical protein [bacterium]
LIYNVEQDPREEFDITLDNLWLLQPAVRKIYEFLFSVDKEGLILPGAEKPEPAQLEIPFQSQDEIDRSMSAIKWRFVKQKVKDMLPFGSDATDAD